MVEAHFGVGMVIHGDSLRAEDSHKLHVELNSIARQIFPKWDTSKLQWSIGVTIYVSGHLWEYDETCVGEVYFSKRRRDIDVPVFISMKNMSLKSNKFNVLMKNLVRQAIIDIIYVVNWIHEVDIEDGFNSKLEELLKKL